ncbi:LysR family transcriptional regulator [Alteromonas pelagimontana]|uniref:HTH-type transcriptional regulator MetR n=1 Tax=Alteromonas pelagimontana TaxID=1858656 RepID=A0A6M4MFP1_9ALTE|nr:LysR family transcriptional regulator [Alteromonas pelagimontana]QJR81882.1 LysR family transcriptional regulator [Alteromonas pelagimontana]
MIERQHLRIVAMIAKKGTLTDAAAALHLTQSALSHGMKKLELEFGVALWHKDGRRLRLSNAGESLLNLAERILPQFENTEEHLAQIAAGKKGVLRIGMECHPCYQWLLKVVKPFLTQFPTVDVDVRQAFKFGGLQALHGYEIDLLLTPDPLFIPTITYVPVFQYEQVLVVANDHPLATKPWVRPQDLANDTLITYPVEPSRLDIFAQFMTPAGGSVKRHKTIETTEILLQMVSAGRGISALPRWLVEEHSQSLPITPVRLGEDGLSKALHIGYRSKDASADYFTAFLEMAKEIGASTQSA